MKKSVCSWLLPLLLLFCSAQSWAATYYVDSSIPDTNVAGGAPDFTTYNPATFDTNTGTEPVYKTLADVAARTFSSGDAVYFRRGQTWNGRLSFSNSVTYGAFGSGALPRIIGSGSDFAGYANSASNFIVQDIEFSNAGYTAVFVYSSFAAANNNTFRRCKFTVTGPVAYASGKYDLCINPGDYPMSGYLIDGNELSGGDSGLLLATWGGPPSLFDFTVSNNYIHDIVGSGIKIYAGIEFASSTSSPYGIDINGNTISHTGYQAIWIMGGLRDVAGHPSYIRNNVATEIGSMSTPNINAFQLNWLRGTIIENNTITNVYTSAPDGDGLFPDIAWGSQSYRSSDVIVRYNKVSGCRAFAGRTAGICAGSTSNSLFYGNISYNNEIGMEFVTSRATGNQFYNNVFDGNSYGVMIPQSMYGLGYAPSSIWRNNIFSNNSTDGFYYAAGNTPPTESNNLFFNNGSADIWGTTTVYPGPGPFLSTTVVIPNNLYYGSAVTVSSPRTIATIGAKYVSFAQSQCWLGLYSAGGGTLLAYGKVTPRNGDWADFMINYPVTAGTYEIWTDCDAAWKINYQDSCAAGSYAAAGPAYPYPPPSSIAARSATAGLCQAVRATYMEHQPLDPADKTSDPLFVNRSAANYQLLAGSPAIDAGLNSIWAGMPSINDAAGTPITNSAGTIVAPGGVVDMGAYEFIAPVKVVVAGGPDQYFNSLSDAISKLPPGSNPMIMYRAGNYTENLTLDLCDETITISGGYDRFFTAGIGATRIDGTVEVVCGTLAVDNLEIGNFIAP